MCTCVLCVLFLSHTHRCSERIPGSGTLWVAGDQTRVSHVQVKHFVFCEEPEVFRLIFTELSCVCNVSCGVWGLQDFISTELPYLTLYLSERQKSMSFILEF